MIFHMYLYDTFKRNMKQFKYDVQEKTKIKDMKPLYFSKFIKWFYGFVDGHRYDIDMFETYIYSDTYTSDVRNIMLRYDGHIDNEIYDMLYSPYFVVERGLSMMSKIRLQLRELEMDGRGELAKHIANYIMVKYKEETKSPKNVFNEFERYYIDYMENFGNNTKFNTLSYVLRNNSYLPIRHISLFMDAYLLGRMFRKFTKNKLHTDSSFVIVYTGNAHTLLYIEFFRDVLGVSFEIYNGDKKINTNNYRCINIKNFEI